MEFNVSDKDLKKFKKDECLIRRRINENLLKVEKESKDVKYLLKLALQSTRPDHCKYDENHFSEIYNNINAWSYLTTRKDLLRTAIILATSRNTYAQENLITAVRARLGYISDKDYIYIAELISLKNPQIVEKVNAYLCNNIKGYKELHQKYYNKYYGV